MVITLKHDETKDVVEAMTVTRLRIPTEPNVGQRVEYDCKVYFILYVNGVQQARGSYARCWPAPCALRAPIGLRPGDRIHAVFRVVDQCNLLEGATLEALELHLED